MSFAVKYQVRLRQTYAFQEALFLHQSQDGRVAGDLTGDDASSAANAGVDFEGDLVVRDVKAGDFDSVVDGPGLGGGDGDLALQVA